MRRPGGQNTPRTAAQAWQFSISKDKKLKYVNKMQVLGICDSHVAVKTAGHFKTLSMKNTQSALMYQDSDI